ncbi:MAG TPA: tripartite tricarboxylate transporter substrate-binding protein [Candidatus Binatia bacterium]|jgi:tripartite-type tricarboxylate transporter receptor subunit TctC|nr:tripartite tricarboxylate transporter substrate-binding protein [Candidatus Binatia bacterium]
MKKVVIGLFFLLLWTSILYAQAPFYQGKTITLVAGTTAGSQYDAHARLIAQHWGKLIPGNPDIIVQNMPGAGSLIAANHLYNMAKPDGLTITSIIPAIYFNQLAGRKEVRFDYSKFNWIGSVDRSDNLIYMRSDTPFKTIYDVRGAAQPPKCTATGTGTVGHYMPKLLNETVGTKFEIVLGYPGGPEMDLAVEKNEAQCRAFTHAAWFSGEPYRTWRTKGFAHVLIQTGRKRDERLPQVPTLNELMDEFKTEETGRRLANVVLTSGELGRPYLLPPGIPAERLKVLREAFMKLMVDRAFLADIKKRGLEVEPSTGEELEQLAKEVMAQPPEVIERVKKLMGN